MTQPAKSRFNTYSGVKAIEIPTKPFAGHQSSQEQRESQANYNPPYAGLPELNINVQEIMPLVCSVREQNQYLKKSKIMLQNDMQKLYKLSQSMVKQNVQLRNHYNMRTNDIKRLIQTITINTTEDVNDIKHQSFLIKQNNFKLVKNIENLMKNLTDLNKENTKKKQQFQKCIKKRSQLDRFIQQLQIRNKQLFQKCEVLKSDQERSQKSKNQNLDQLFFEVVQLRNINNLNFNKAKNIQHKHNTQRPSYEDNYDNLIKQNQQLQNQVLSLKDNLTSAQKVLESRQTNHYQVLIQLNQTIRKLQSMRENVSNNDQTIQKLKKQHTQSVNNISKITDQFYKYTSQRQKLQDKVNQKKQNIKNLIKNGKQMEQSQNQRLHTTIKKIRGQIHQQTCKADEQIKLKINPQSTSVQQAINSSEQQYNLLIQEIDELNTSLNRMENPLKQIIRIQFMLKKNKQNSRY